MTGYCNQLPLEEGTLKVDEINEVYYARFGNPDGIPVIFCHGGPGSGVSYNSVDFFNPKVYHTIIFDQRGCGKSKPFLSTHNNTIDYLVADIEQIRTKFNLEKFIIFGGSFGSTLSLAYAIKHPDRILAMVLRGIFLARQSDVDWLYEFGASEFFPEEHRNLKKLVQNKNVIKNYYKLFRNANTRAKALKQFANYEGNIASINYLPADPNSDLNVYEEQIAFLENYYFFHKVFKTDNYILDNVDKIKNIKTYIVHGRYDLICRPSSAYELKESLNDASLYFAPLSGHSSRDSGIFDKLVSIMDTIKDEFTKNISKN